MSEPESILDFWLHDVGEDGWYEAVDEVDAEIRERFLPAWEAARAGGRDFWLNGPRGTLAYLVLTDQFPRNMFRGKPEAFATDSHARAAATMAVEKGYDLKIPEPERVFFYMPFEHSEDMADQDRCVDLFEKNLHETRDGFLLHAHAHREIIRRFGRFPFRNAALGRKTTADEQAFLDSGGYRKIVEEIQKNG